MKILQATCYSKPVLSGLVISTGGLQESLRKVSTSALVGYLQDSNINAIDEGKSRECLLSHDILWVLQHYQKCDRVITPTLKVTIVCVKPDHFCVSNSIRYVACDS